MSMNRNRFLSAVTALSMLLFNSCTLLSGERSLDTDSTQLIAGKLSEVLTSSDLTSVSISAGDSPYGYAAVGAEENFGGYDGTSLSGTVVTTRAELVSALASGGIIYIKGMIDVTDTGDGTMLPDEAGGSTDALDAFVSSMELDSDNEYDSYSDWKIAYFWNCDLTTDDSSDSSETKSDLYDDLWAFSDAYKKIVLLTVKSDTTIIGINSDDGSASGITGGNLLIKNVSNVAIRNIVIQNAYDPFPHHEANDGYNAQWDCITIQNNNSNIWIDHCTFQDTMYVDYVHTNGNFSNENYYEKWQDFDGLLDIKGISTNITISHNRFLNHDKTMLIGSSDSEQVTEDGATEKRNVLATDRYITLDHNLYYNCGQRLPMVRLTSMVITNNYFDFDNGHYKQQYAIGPKYNALLIVQGNYFGSGINYTLKGDGKTDSMAYVYFADNVEASLKKTSAYPYASISLSTSNMPFTPDAEAFSYTLENASDLPDTLPASSGAGCTTVTE